MDVTYVVEEGSSAVPAGTYSPERLAAAIENQLGTFRVAWDGERGVFVLTPVMQIVANV